MEDDFVHETKIPNGIRERPLCEAPGCDNPKRGALISFNGKWVCGNCAAKKQEELNARIWA